MKTIVEAISDLLYVRDVVVVPGLGAFVKKPTSAQVNRVANFFSAPSCVIEFDADLREDNDLIVNYIAKENDIPEDEAQRLLAIFVSDCFNKMKEGKSAVLKGIGVLRYDWHSDIVLEQEASSNFNSDAFGLCDFTTVSMAHHATKDEIKAEIEQQQRDKNTPVTVDEKAVREGLSRHRVWPRLLLAVLLLTGVAFGLYYFRIVDFGKWLRPQTPTILSPDTIGQPEEPVAQKVMGVNDTVRGSETDTVALIEVDTLLLNDTVKSVVGRMVEEVESVVPEAKIMIVAGCFSVEEYAVNLADNLKGQGYEAAFVEKRGSKWFVAYGRYHTLDEASAILNKIKADDADTKAWIKK